MARGSDINQRIVLTGAEEVRRHLEEIGKAGERSGNTTRSALLAATQGTNAFTAGAKSASASSGQMRFALQNLSFQVNDVATSLASGGDVMRVFAQQGGQVFQVFQQGGGAKAVLGGAATAISSMITPMRLAAAGAIALAAGIAALVARAQSIEGAGNRFNQVLAAMGKSSQGLGAQLAQQARELRSVGLSASEAETAMTDAIKAGVRPQQAQEIARIGQNLQLALGPGTAQAFAEAVGKGGAAAEAMAEKLGVLSRSASGVDIGFKNTSDTISEGSKSINAAIASQGQSITDARRQAGRQLEGIQRESNQRISEIQRAAAGGDEKAQKEANDKILGLQQQRRQAEENAQRQLSHALEDINRQSTQRINELIAQRNEAGRRELVAANQLATQRAQAAGESSRLVAIARQREAEILKNLTPQQQAVRDLSAAWGEFLDKLAQSQAIQSLVTGLKAVITAVTSFAAANPKITAFGAALVVLTPIVAAFVVGIRALTVAMLANPFILIATAIAAIGVAIVTYWPQISAFFTNLLQGFGSLGQTISQTWSALWQRVGEIWSGFVQFLTEQWSGLSRWASETWTGITTAIGDAWKGLWEWAAGVWDWIFEKIISGVNTIGEWFTGWFTKIGEAWKATVDFIGGWVDWVVGKIQAAINKAKELAGVGGAGGMAAGGLVQGMAAGGLVRGRGTGTSDSVPIWASDGEFMFRKAAVQAWGAPLLAAMNALNGPIMPKRRSLGFASGGLVAAGAGGGSSVYFQFPSGASVGPMMADRQVREAMEREAKRAGMRSAGKRPSTA